LSFFFFFFFFLFFFFLLLLLLLLLLLVLVLGLLLLLLLVVVAAAEAVTRRAYCFSVPRMTAERWPGMHTSLNIELRVHEPSHFVAVHTPSTYLPVVTLIANVQMSLVGATLHSAKKPMTLPPYDLPSWRSFTSKLSLAPPFFLS
jgi:hypothetical protein